MLVAWLAAGVALAFFDRPLWDALWLVGVAMLWLLYAAVGACLFVALFYAGIAGRDRVALISAAGFVAGGVALWFAMPLISSQGDAFVFRYRFLRNRPAYDRIVEQASHEQLGQSDGQRDGVLYVLDAGPPVRVAFPQPGGIIDNWEGVIHDPTHALRELKGWDGPGFLTSRLELRKLFGGDIIACQHVEDAYYRCWFT